MRNTPYTQNMDPYAENTDTTGIDSSDYIIGAQINKCIPAKWWNTLFGSLIRRVRQSRNDFNVIYQEFLSVLNEAGITPDEEESDQLLQALKDIRDAQPIALSDALGFVRSAGGKVNVSVNPSTGEMTAVGVGDIFSSISGITTNPSVQDIISALTFLSNNILGRQLVIPTKPENWQIADGDYWIHNSGGSGVHQNEPLIILATKGKSYSFDVTLQPGWYRFAIWGGSGGKGGSGGYTRGYYSYSTPGGSGTGSTGAVNGNAGAAGTQTKPFFTDMYLPVETKINGLVGGGGNSGSTGKGANSSGAGWNSDTGAGGAATTVDADSYEYMATRMPAFIQGLAGQAGGANSELEFSFYESSVSGSGTLRCGGGGGGGGNGGGTFIRVGRTPLFCCGFPGGNGGGHSGGRISSLLASFGSGSSITATPANYPSVTGGTGGNGYSAAIRAPLVWSTGFSRVVTNNPGIEGPEPLPDNGSGSHWSYQTDIREYVSPGLREGTITKTGSTASISVGGANYSFNTSYSLTDGFPGGMAIFRGVNV